MTPSRLVVLRPLAKRQCRVDGVRGVGFDGVPGSVIDLTRTGRDPMTGKTEMVSALMSPAVAGRLHEVARAQSISRSELIRRAVGRELAQFEEKSGDAQSAA
jgi:hypothetical protein